MLSSEWASAIFRTLIISALTWVVIYLRKQAIPFLKRVKKYSELDETVDANGKRISVLESKNSAIHDIAFDPVFMINLKGEVTYVNAAFSEMGGFKDPRDAHGFGFMAAIPEKDKEKALKLNERTVLHPATFDGEIEYQQIGTKKIVITHCRTALLYENAVLVGIIGRLKVISISNP